MGLLGLGANIMSTGGGAEVWMCPGDLTWLLLTACARVWVARARSRGVSAAWRRWKAPVCPV